jgi:hypothetical protein
MYSAGLKNVSDAIGAHPSGYNCPAGADWQTVQDPTAASFHGAFENRHHSWCFRGSMEGYRNVMIANGDGTKTIWPTEFGWASSPHPPPLYEYARDNTLEEQAQWTVEAYQMAKQWGWVSTMFLWNLDYGVTAADKEQGMWGLVRPGGPTPAYHALANMLSSDYWKANLFFYTKRSAIGIGVTQRWTTQPNNLQCVVPTGEAMAGRLGAANNVNGEPLRTLKGAECAEVLQKAVVAGNGSGRCGKCVRYIHSYVFKII